MLLPTRQALCLEMRSDKEIFVIGDGARWIRKIWQQCFPKAAYILDWYHLRENLYKAIRLTSGVSVCKHRDYIQGDKQPPMERLEGEGSRGTEAIAYPVTVGWEAAVIGAG
jgi:uncharacterized protein UPF0236